MVKSGSIPVLDMQEISGQPEKMVNALERWGCFRLVNHRIPTTLMSDMKAVSLSLFELPLGIKERNVSPQRLMGYIPRNTINSFYEALGVYNMPTTEAVDQFCTQLVASPHQREIVHQYSEAMDALAQELGRKIMEGFGLVGDLFRGWSCHLRLNKYDNTTETLGLTGIPTHSDQGFITIVFDDEMITGLEIVDEETGKCIPLDPLAGSFLVNSGDIAKVWSNGRLCNVKHRVQSREPKVRASIAYFVLGPMDTKVEAPAELVDAEHPRLYVPLDFEQYGALRLSKSVTGDALEYYRQQNSDKFWIL